MWTAVPTVAVAVRSPTNEGTSLAEAIMVVAQDHLGQKSIAQIAEGGLTAASSSSPESPSHLGHDSSQTQVDPESPVPGPSGLFTCGRSDEFAPCPEIFNQEKPTKKTRFGDVFLFLTPSQQGPKRKVYSPMTATVIS
ncbi:uncharacterized protein LOC142776430 isoform X2 [Rhipicephalus microplus]|uniref:uncharacterized protein LOC142776430 isoform X2 n=1 Tax=Rhipicephalus microplus TaxID=6941 RepID=UPI003F6CDD1F